MIRRIVRVIIIWLILLTLGSELALRVWAEHIYHSPLPEGTVQSFEESPLLPDGIRTDVLQLQPGYSGIADSTGVEYSINSWGYRDDEPDWTRQHVLFLGDSTTFGLNIPHEATYAEVWEQLAGADWQAINTAIPGRGMISSYETLQEVLAKGLCPHYVVIGFFGGNDPRNDANAQVPISNDALYLVRLGRYFIDSVQQQSQSDIAISLDYLGRILTLAETIDAKPIVIYIAYNGELNHPTGLDQQVKQVAQDHTAPFINTLTLYQSYMDEHHLTTIPAGFYSVPGDMAHPGILSSQLIGQTLAEVMP
jgi:hypothetical protein